MIKNKGSKFEREVCKLLSLWWTYGKDDAVFWRTSISGGRAKIRSKKNLKTFGQHGDIQATNPIGQKLIDVCSIEVKRGYTHHTFAEMLDKADHNKEQMYEKFVYQAEEDSANANAYSWLLIVKRDGKKALVFMPYPFKKELVNKGCILHKKHPIVSFSMEGKEDSIYRIFGMTLDNFLKTVKPSHIKKIHDESKKYFSPIINDRKVPEYDTRLDQVFKCTSQCDMDEVRWDGTQWICDNCGMVNDYPI